MKKLIGVLILCACLMTACQGGGTGAGTASGETASSSEVESTDSSAMYEVTNNYSGIYQGTLTIDDFNDSTGAATVEKGASQQVQFKISYLDDTFGTIASYDSTGSATGSLPFTSEGSKLRMLADYSEDESEVNKQEINLTFEEKDGVVTASGTMEMAQGEDWIKGSITLTKTEELPDSAA